MVVSPVGTDSENGQALRNALLRITDASATKRYLLQVEAGTYDLGGGYDTSTLVMKEHVDIQGAGELGTVITSRSPLTVKGASKAELRFLAVRNTLPSSRAIAIYNDSASPRLTRVTAESIGAGGSENIGVYNYNSSSPTMTDVTATASGATSNYGVYSVDSSPTIKHSRLSGSTRSLFHGSPTGITRVALTELVGPILGSSGNLRCFDNYDQDLAPVICP